MSCRRVRTTVTKSVTLAVHLPTGARHSRLLRIHDDSIFNGAVRTGLHDAGKLVEDWVSAQPFLQFLQAGELSNPTFLDRPFDDLHGLGIVLHATVVAEASLI